MPTRTVEFLGRNFIRPGAYGAFRAKPQPAGISPDLNTQILIGPSDNGWHAGDSNLEIFQRIMEFSSFEEARAVLGGGDLLDAIKSAFSPSRDSRFASGPQLIRALNINPNVAASAQLDNVSAVAQTVRALIPGPKGNSLRLRVSSSGDRIEINDGSETITRTGLSQSDITLLYSGDAGTAQASWDGTTFTVALTGQTDGTEDISIPASQVKTLEELTERVNSQAGYAMGITSSPDRLVSELDHFSGIDVTTLASFSSTRARQAAFMRQTGLLSLELTGTQVPLADNLAFVYLSGGATGAGGSSDYLDAIDLQKKTTGLYINVCTGISAVVAGLFEAVKEGNSIEGRNERFGGAGDDDVLSLFDDRIQEGKAINSEYMVYGISPVTMFRADGVTEKTYPGWMLAVLHNAIKASNNVREAAHHKDLNIIDAPEILSNTQIKNALLHGCLAVDRKPNNGPFKIILDVTTYNKTNTILNKASSVCLALALNKDLRESLDNEFTGEVPTDPRARATQLTDADIRTFIEDKFDIDYVQNFGWLTQNIYTGEDAWDRNFSIQRDGNVFYFIFPDGKVVTSIDYMFHLLNLDVVRGVSTGG